MNRIILCTRAADVVKETGAYLRRHMGQVAEADQSVKDHPTHYDTVTIHDREAEQRLRDGFQAFDPTIGFTGEEFGCHQDGEVYWLVDPIDGTDAYIRGLPFSTVQVALIEAGEPVIGIIYDFVRDEMFYAVRGEGAYCNRTRICVSDRDLRTGRLVAEINTRDFEENGRLLLRMRKQAFLYQCFASGWELAQAACGRLEGKIFCKPWAQPLDIAPGAVLIQEAGGVVANIGSSSYDFCKTDVIATNQVIYAQLTEGENALFPIAGTSLAV